MMRIPLSHHGYSGSPLGGVTVEPTDGEPTISLSLDAETATDLDAVRSLEPDEALEVAAALIHYARRIERTR